MKTFRDIWQIAKKDLLEFARDKLRLVTFMIMPIFMMVLTGFIFPNQSTIREVPIGITGVDQKFGKQLVEVISNIEMTKGSKAFIIKEYQNSEQIKEAIIKQDINGGLVLPEDFSQKIMSPEQAEVTIILDQADPQISAITTQTLLKVIDTFSKKIGQVKIETYLNAKPSDGQEKKLDTTAFISPIKTNTEATFKGETNYFDFVAPGIIAMVVMTAVLTGLAASVAHEKEQGTLDGILISPISRISIIIGKATSQSIRGLIQGAMVMLLAVFLFGVHINGSIILVALLLLLGIFSFVGLGILVSASAAEQETATQILFMFQFPMLFLSGVFYPIQQMPIFMQAISKMLPLTYAIQALRKIMILGAGFMDVASEVIILTLFGIVTISIAVPLFRKIITK